MAGSKSEDACWGITDDSNNHCVWCSIATSGFGFCVNESQAEAMEKSIPNVQCDRYSETDDATPVDDDAAPKTDDNVTPSTDDQVPDNYWECLLKKTPTDCEKLGCTWCDTKGGYGLCLSGPVRIGRITLQMYHSISPIVCFSLLVVQFLIFKFFSQSAERADDSDWFTCRKSEDQYLAFLEDPMDLSCVLAFMKSPTEDGCVNAHDQDGNPCQWCNLAGMTNVCLTAEQAEMGASLGITCDARGTLQDPLDPSCALAYIQDPSKESCLAAVDADGNPCEFCTLQGALQICLNADQAQMGEAFGISCDSLADPRDMTCALAQLQDPNREHCLSTVDAEGTPCEYCIIPGSGIQMCVNAEQAQMGEEFGLDCGPHALKELDPYDPSCLVAYLENASQEACVTAVDSNGNPCEFCTLQGALDLCLTAEQAEFGQQVGITCTAKDVFFGINDPYDPSCALAYLQDPTKDACLAATDSDGNACEFCTLQGALQLCLNAEQAQMGEEFGIECDAKDSSTTVGKAYDPSCALGYLQDSSKETCTATMDVSGNHCKFCSLQGALNICLTVDQATIGEEMGMSCGDDSKLELPPDFFKCMENYDEDDCRPNACTWCNTEVGMSFCLSTAAADATKECTFFDCQFGNTPVKKNDDIFDPVCLTAGINGPDHATACSETQGLDDKPCVWCDASGVFGLCLSTDQARKADSFFDCDFDQIVTASE
jgi:hypothetical protein